MNSQNPSVAPRPVSVMQLVTGLGVGGAERAVVNLSTVIARHGVPTTVVSLNSDRAILQQYSDLQIPIISVGMQKSIGGSLRAMFRLASIVRRERFSVIHAHMFHALVAALWCRLVRPGVRIVFTSHSFAGFSVFRRVLIKLTRSFRAVDIVFSADQHAGLNAADCRAIPNGVVIADMPSRAPARDRPFVFLFVGRLAPVKNPQAAVEAFAAANLPDAELWLAGDGPQRGALAERVMALGPNRTVKVLGQREDVASLMKRADCLVMSSRWEGLPMVILEAGAAALPVIAPNVGAIPQLLGEECGYLTELSTLAATMTRVASDRDDAIRRGRRLFSRVSSQFSLDAVADRHVKLYREISER